MAFTSILDSARQIIRDHAEPGSMVLDATMGNGYDTLFLAEIVGDEGLVVALDIQDDALVRTRSRLEAAGLSHRTRLLMLGHEEVARALEPAPVRPLTAAMYNLGYLPGSDGQITTRPETTLASLDQVTRLLAPCGAVTIVGYSGHRGGEQEVGAVLQWSRLLSPERFDVVHYRWLNRVHAPELIGVRKKDGA